MERTGFLILSCVLAGCVAESGEFEFVAAGDVLDFESGPPTNEVLGDVAGVYDEPGGRWFVAVPERDITSPSDLGPSNQLAVYEIFEHENDHVEYRQLLFQRLEIVSSDSLKMTVGFGATEETLTLSTVPASASPVAEASAGVAETMYHWIALTPRERFVKPELQVVRQVAEAGSARPVRVPAPVPVAAVQAIVVASDTLFAKEGIADCVQNVMGSVYATFDPEHVFPPQDNAARVDVRFSPSGSDVAEVLAARGCFLPTPEPTAPPPETRPPLAGPVPRVTEPASDGGCQSRGGRGGLWLACVSAVGVCVRRRRQV